MREKAKKIAELLKLIANENRLMIFCALIEGPKTVSEISKKIPQITQPALSQHLALLKAHGLLDSRKTGQNVTYRIADNRIEKVIGVLKEYYCDPAKEENHG
jgi:DNA-binding transcriptional ArsR family regulator